MLEHAYGYDDVAIVPGEFTINPELAETTFKIQELDYKNSLLTKDIDLDFIEVLIRDKFLFGKDGETTYILKDDGQN